MVDHAALSDVGRQREGNEDSMLVEPPLFVVADGMGGAQAGEVASGPRGRDAGRVAAGRRTTPRTTLVEAITEANRRIHDKAQEDRELAGHGHDADRGARARRQGHDRPRRRLARLPLARRASSRS